MTRPISTTMIALGIIAGLAFGLGNASGAATYPCLNVTTKDFMCGGYSPMACECLFSSGCTSSNTIVIHTKKLAVQSDYLARCETVPCATTQVCGPNPADPCEERFLGYFGTCMVFGDVMGHGTQSQCTQTSTPC